MNTSKRNVVTFGGVKDWPAIVTPLQWCYLPSFHGSLVCWCPHFPGKGWYRGDFGTGGLQPFSWIGARMNQTLYLLSPPYWTSVSPGLWEIILLFESSRVHIFSCSKRTQVNCFIWALAREIFALIWHWIPNHGSSVGSLGCQGYASVSNWSLDHLYFRSCIDIPSSQII